MTQDLGVPLYEGFHDIYYQQTPDYTEYPGGCRVYWKSFEDQLTNYIEQCVTLEQLMEGHSIYFRSEGDIGYRQDVENLAFRVLVSNPGMMPLAPCLEEKPDVELVCDSCGWSKWSDFVRSVNYAIETQPVKDEVWHEQLEEQYLVCALRALRRVTANSARLACYAGFLGDTAEEWINRTSDLPRQATGRGGREIVQAYRERYFGLTNEGLLEVRASGGLSNVEMRVLKDDIRRRKIPLKERLVFRGKNAGRFVRGMAVWICFIILIAIVREIFDG